MYVIEIGILHPSFAILRGPTSPSLNSNISYIYSRPLRRNFHNLASYANVAVISNIVSNYICGLSISTRSSKMIAKEVLKWNKKETHPYLYGLSSTMGCIYLRDPNTYRPKFAKMMLYPLFAIGVDFFMFISIFCFINFVVYSIIDIIYIL